MERAILLLSDDALTQEQLTELKYRYDIYRHITLPKELIRLWTNINRIGEFNRRYFKPIREYITGLKSSGLCYCLVHGENCAVFYMVSFLLSEDMIPLCSTTYQVVGEHETGDGDDEKQHIYFQKYIPYIA